MLTALHVADILASEVGASEAVSRGSQPDLEYLAVAGVSDRLHEWRELARQMAAETVTRG